MSAFGGDAWQRKAMSHKSSFIIIDEVLLRESSFPFFFVDICCKSADKHCACLQSTRNQAAYILECINSIFVGRICAKFSTLEHSIHGL